MWEELTHSPSPSNDDIELFGRKGKVGGKQQVAINGIIHF